jgi:hypothetical protein
MLFKVRCAMFQVLVADLSLQRPGFNHRPVHMVYAVDKVALRQVSFYKYIGFYVSLSFNQCSVPFLSSITDAVHLSN